jgi:hypothetical protein
VVVQKITEAWTCCVGSGLSKLRIQTTSQMHVVPMIGSNTFNHPVALDTLSPVPKLGELVNPAAAPHTYSPRISKDLLASMLDFHRSSRSTE